MSSSLPTGKASGEENISNRIINKACKAAAEYILTVFNRCKIRTENEFSVANGIEVILEILPKLETNLLMIRNLIILLLYYHL